MCSAPGSVCQEHVCEAMVIKHFGLCVHLFLAILRCKRVCCVKVSDKMSEWGEMIWTGVCQRAAERLCTFEAGREEYDFIQWV